MPTKELFVDERIVCKSVLSKLDGGVWTVCPLLCNERAQP
jgi:hypothetical protein